LVGWPVASEVDWLVGWWYNGLRPTKCGCLDHVHAAREGSDWLTPPLEALGSGLGLIRISIRNITSIENLPIPLHPTNQPTNYLTSGWLVDYVRRPPVGWLVNQPTGQPLATAVGW
jgi:hypothetical protein